MNDSNKVNEIPLDEIYNGLVMTIRKIRTDTFQTAIKEIQDKLQQPLDILASEVNALQGPDQKTIQTSLLYISVIELAYGSQSTAGLKSGLVETIEASLSKAGITKESLMEESGPFLEALSGRDNQLNALFSELDQNLQF